MTKKELHATMILLSSIRSTIEELKSYGRDYNVPSVGIIGQRLEESTQKFRKEAKL